MIFLSSPLFVWSINSILHPSRASIKPIIHLPITCMESIVHGHLSTLSIPITEYLDAVIMSTMTLYMPIHDYLSGDLPLACTKVDHKSSSFPRAGDRSFQSKIPDDFTTGACSYFSSLPLIPCIHPPILFKPTDSYSPHSQSRSITS